MAISSEWAGPPVEWSGLPVSPTLPYLRVSKLCLMRPGLRIGVTLIKNDIIINSVLRQLRQSCYLAAAVTKSKSRYMSPQTHTFHTIYIKQYPFFTSLSPQIKPLNFHEPNSISNMIKNVSHSQKLEYHVNISPVREQIFHVPISLLCCCHHPAPLTL